MFIGDVSLTWDVGSFAFGLGGSTKGFGLNDINNSCDGVS
jgi:hypothetical protein